MYELKRGDKVSCRGREWYYVGVDNVGDHLMREDKGYDGPVSCSAWGNHHEWTWVGDVDVDDITLIEELITPSPLENAIEEYKRLNGIVDTRPFVVNMATTKCREVEYPSLYYRFNKTTLEYYYGNKWNKAQASVLCLILFNTSEFLYLKGDEPREVTPIEWKPKVGDKVRILPRKDGQEDQFPHYTDEMTKYVGSEHTITGRNESSYRLDSVSWNWHKDWLEHVE